MTIGSPLVPQDSESLCEPGNEFIFLLFLPSSRIPLQLLVQGLCFEGASSCSR